MNCYFENETIVGIDPMTTIAYSGIKLKVYIQNNEATVKEILKTKRRRSFKKLFNFLKAESFHIYKNKKNILIKFNCIWLL